MSNGFYSPSHPSSRHQRRDNLQDIQHNLAELGLIGSTRRSSQKKDKDAKTKTKTVEFGSPVATHSTESQFILSPSFYAQAHSCLF